MASSPPSSPLAEQATSECGSDKAFALQELHACWQQAFEALSRGDLAVATNLMDVADRHVRTAGDGADDSADEARLRATAGTTYGMLQHAITSGMAAIANELGRARKGAKALRGYDRVGATGRRLQRDA